MMKAKEYGKGMGRDTIVCGGLKSWFPMRGTYSREMKIKGELDRSGDTVLCTDDVLAGGIFENE